jgi:hypothetical protein
MFMIESQVELLRHHTIRIHLPRVKAETAANGPGVNKTC